MDNKYLIKVNTTIKEAMDKLEEIKPKILFVVEKNRLIGTLTDGDIRRAIIKGNSINDKVDVALNSNPKIAKDINEAKRMCSKDYIAIPIVENNKLIDIYFEDENQKSNILINVPVVINAGGQGTRLRSLSSLPKPLIPIGEYPILSVVMNEFRSFGCKSFNVIVNYKKELIKSYYRDNKEYKIKFYDEKSPLGTAGGLKLLEGKIKDTFIFSNCDTLIKDNYNDIIEFHKNNNCVITAVCVNKKIDIPYGVIEINKNNTIKKFLEKPKAEYITNTGLYIVEPEIFNNIKKDEKIDFPEIIEREIQKGKRVSVYLTDENNWYDMGQVSTYEETKNRLFTK